jgi:REP element-mobilizing transposase RayT
MRDTPGNSNKIREEIEIYHWCLMGNHYHLVLKLKNPERISKLIGGIQQVYAQYHHKRYHTAGRLFGSWFKSQVIEDEDYLLICGRYVERNPVRAGLVKNAWDWADSSAKYYVSGRKDKITDKNPQWADDSGQEYKKWLEKETEEDVELFHGTGTVIKLKGKESKRLIIDGRIVGHKKGRKKMPSNALQ